MPFGDSPISRACTGEIRRRQLAWARSHGVATQAGYCPAPEANLPWLNARTCADVEEGDGNEFGRPGRRGKICALHSSSALALNVFGYWQSRDRAPLEKVLGLPSTVEDVRFERKYDTGVPPRSPNIDVVLPLADGSVFAIESKFTEWCGNSGAKPLRDAYLPSGIRRWTNVGLGGAQAVVEPHQNHRNAHGNPTNENRAGVTWSQSSPRYPPW